LKDSPEPCLYVKSVQDTSIPSRRHRLRLPCEDVDIGVVECQLKPLQVIS